MCNCDPHHDPRETTPEQDEHQVLLQRAARKFTQSLLIANARGEPQGPISRPIPGVESPYFVGDRYFSNPFDAERERIRQRQAAERAEMRRTAAAAQRHAAVLRDSGNDDVVAFLEQLAESLVEAAHTIDGRAA